MSYMPGKFTGGRGNEMVIRETAPVFAGRYPGIFHIAFVPVFLRWNFFLRGCVPDNPVFGCQVSDLARPGAGLDYSDVCYASDQWCAASVRGDSGAISGRIYLEVKNRPVYLLKETDEEETENEG